MKEKLLRFKDFVGPYDYRPGFIYLTILVLNLSNLRSFTYEYEYGMERIKFFFTGLLVYATIGLPLYLVLKLTQKQWGSRRKNLKTYFFELFLGSLITIFAQAAGKKYLLPHVDTVDFLQSGVFVGDLITRFLFALIFVAITHNRLKVLNLKLDAASALNNELNERYAILIESDEETRSHASALLHDRIQGKLMLAGAKLTRVSEVISDEGKLGILPVIKEIEQIRAIDVREVSQLLTPNLAGEGLIGSCENLSKEFSDVAFTLDICQEVELLEEALKLGIYRIIEQGVINSIKHGPASHITLRIADNGQNEVCVEVIDNGPGGVIFGAGKGSVIIDAWLSILGGRTEIESEPGKGFTLRAYLPKK